MTTFRPSMPVPASFDRRARVTMPGYDAMHDLGACLLKNELPRDARILVVGAGTFQEVFSLARHGRQWTFAAVEPSHDMVQKARGRMIVEGIASERVKIERSLEDVAQKPRFDAATVLLMLHLLETRKEQLDLLTLTAKRMKRGAPLLIALPCTNLDPDDAFVQAWRRRLRSQGMTEADVKSHLAVEMARTAITQPEQVLSLLAETGFTSPRRYFSSLFFHAWIARRED